MPSLAAGMPKGFTLGLFYILLIVIIWTFGSILVQYIFLNLNFDGPFILTYLCSALFSVYLLVYCVTQSCTANDSDAQKYATLSTDADEEAAGGEGSDEEAQKAPAPKFMFMQTLSACMAVMPLWFAANW